MDPIAACSNIIVDEEEIKTYHRYFELPKNIAKNSSLDYYSFREQYPDEIVEQGKWTQFTETLFTQTDFEKIKNRNDAYRDFRSDLDTFDKYSAFDYTSLDSYKLEKIIWNTTDTKENQLLQNQQFVHIKQQKESGYQIKWNEDLN